MKRSKSIAKECSSGWLIDLIFITSLILTLCAPLALAGEAQPVAAVKDQAQPEVPAGQAPAGSEKAMAQALDSASTADSINFLMDNSPLAKGPVAEAAPTIAVPEPAPKPVSPSDIRLEVLEGRVVEESDEVAMLVSEQCDNAGEGASSCERAYSNGHHATVVTQNANEGDEFKSQTVVEEFDADNTLLYRKTIRNRVDYNYVNDKKAKEKEFFDIIYQPAGKKTTRELMVYEYFLDTGKTKSLSWTQYKQIGHEPKAELVYHALLRYGDDGSPVRGLAERWDHGQKADTFMNWSRQSKGYATLDEEAWGQWEGWIRTVSMQAYLP
jgi:hypothetical protein